MRWVLAGWVVFAAGVGCGDSERPGDGGRDSGATRDAGGMGIDGGGSGVDAGGPSGDAGACAAPVITTPTWLTARLEEVEAALTGQAEITPRR